MSHYYCLAVLPPGTTDIADAVADLMAPHVEDYNEETDEMTGWWDWWVIGGRWTGVLDDYDPHEDPANREVCDLCSGTGTRPDGLERFGAEWAAQCNGCNGCDGKGIRVKWSTSWAPHAGDVQRLGDVRVKLTDARPYRVIGPELMAVAETYNPEGTHYDDEPYETAKFQKHPEQVLLELSALADDCIVVVVDYHN